MTFTRPFLLLAACLSVASPASGDADRSTWLLTFDTRWLGPMEAHVEIVRDGDRIAGRSLGGAAAVLSGLPGDHAIDDAVMAFEAVRGDDGSYAGTFLAPWREGALSIVIDGDSLAGTVGEGALAGKVTGSRVRDTAPIRDYAAILSAFDRVVAAKAFDPADLEAPGYRQFREAFGRIAAAAGDDLDLLVGFHLAWRNDPFSHFRLTRSQQTAAELFASFDEYRVGFDAATVEIDGDTAILTVRTMMGADTIEQIEAAYDSIAVAGASTLIIDLRGNGGGAFAVKPLVEHVIDEPLDAGFFLSQVWNRDHATAPTPDEALAAPAWSGWSIVSFWHAVQERGITRVRFRPAEPNFDGEVFVLVDGKSASATELAADAFRASGLATLVGERTAGEMLSQSMFDVADGFVVSLPVADYHSLAHGRIEGAGVPVRGAPARRAVKPSARRRGSPRVPASARCLRRSSPPRR